MSDYYEFVISCFLPEDTPEPVLAELRWHLGETDERPPHLDKDAYPLMAPDEVSYLPGGDIAILRLQVVGLHPETHADIYEWALFARNYYHEDVIGEVEHLFQLVASYATEAGYGGHLRSLAYPSRHEFVFRGGGQGYDVLNLSA